MRVLISLSGLALLMDVHAGAQDVGKDGKELPVSGSRVFPDTETTPMNVRLPHVALLTSLSPLLLPGFGRNTDGIQAPLLRFPFRLTSPPALPGINAQTAFSAIFPTRQADKNKCTSTICGSQKAANSATADTNESITGSNYWTPFSLADAWAGQNGFSQWLQRDNAKVGNRKPTLTNGETTEMQPTSDLSDVGKQSTDIVAGDDQQDLTLATPEAGTDASAAEQGTAGQDDAGATGSGEENLDTTATVVGAQGNDPAPLNTTNDQEYSTKAATQSTKDNVGRATSSAASLSSNLTAEELSRQMAARVTDKGEDNYFEAHQVALPSAYDGEFKYIDEGSLEYMDSSLFPNTSRMIRNVGERADTVTRNIPTFVRNAIAVADNAINPLRSDLYDYPYMVPDAYRNIPNFGDDVRLPYPQLTGDRYMENEPLNLRGEINGTVGDISNQKDSLLKNAKATTRDLRENKRSILELPNLKIDRNNSDKSLLERIESVRERHGTEDDKDSKNLIEKLRDRLDGPDGDGTERPQLLRDLDERFGNFKLGDLRLGKQSRNKPTATPAAPEEGASGEGASGEGASGMSLLFTDGTAQAEAINVLAAPQAILGSINSVVVAPAMGGINRIVGIMTPAPSEHNCDEATTITTAENGGTSLSLPSLKFDEAITSPFVKMRANLRFSPEKADVGTAAVQTTPELCGMVARGPVSTIAKASEKFVGDVVKALNINFVGSTEQKENQVDAMKFPASQEKSIVDSAKEAVSMAFNKLNLGGTVSQDSTTTNENSARRTLSIASDLRQGKNCEHSGSGLFQSTFAPMTDVVKRMGSNFRQIPRIPGFASQPIVLKSQFKLSPSGIEAKATRGSYNTAIPDIVSQTCSTAKSISQNNASSTEINELSRVYVDGSKGPFDGSFLGCGTPALNQTSLGSTNATESYSASNSKKGVNVTDTPIAGAAVTRISDASKLSVELGKPKVNDAGSGNAFDRSSKGEHDGSSTNNITNDKVPNGNGSELVGNQVYAVFNSTKEADADTSQYVSTDLFSDQELVQPAVDDAHSSNENMISSLMKRFVNLPSPSGSLLRGIGPDIPCLRGNSPISFPGNLFSGMSADNQDLQT